MRRPRRLGDHTYVRRGWASAYRRSRAASAFSQFSTQIFNFLSLRSRSLLRVSIILYSSKSTPILNFPLRFSILSPFSQFSIILYSSQLPSESFTFSQFCFFIISILSSFSQFATLIFKPPLFLCFLSIFNLPTRAYSIGISPEEPCSTEIWTLLYLSLSCQATITLIQQGFLSDLMLRCLPGISICNLFVIEC